MGQRHQIYAILPYTFKQQKEFNWGEEKPEYVDSNVVALHHQWLYGTLPLRRLNQLFAFYQKGHTYKFHVFNKEGSFSGLAEKALQTLYSLDIEEGQFYGVSLLMNDAAKNPRLGDNNDGITIIDFREAGKPKYAFMFLHRAFETAPFQALSAEDYVRSYYNEEEYAQLGYEEEAKTDTEAAISELLSALAPYPVLSTKEVQAVFPSMFEKKETRT